MMNAINELFILIMKHVELQIVFVVLLLVFIYRTIVILKYLTNKIKCPKDHMLGFYCKNSNKFFPINLSNVFIKPRLSDRAELERKLIVFCVCKEIHELSIPVRPTNASIEQRLKEMRELSIPRF